MDLWCLCLLCFAVLLHVLPASGQSVSINPIPGIGGKHGRWYVWVIVSICGAFLFVILFFVGRGFWNARKRRNRERARQAARQAKDVEFGAVPTTYNAAYKADGMPETPPAAGKGSLNGTVAPSPIMEDEKPVLPPSHDFSSPLDTEDLHRRMGAHDHGPRKLSKTVSSV